MTRKLVQWIKNNKTLRVNAGALVGSTGVTSILGFVYWWLAARQNTPEVVGLASAAISAMTLLGAFSVMGLGTLLIGELPNQRGKEASLISAALILVALVGGGAGIVYAVVASHLASAFQVLGGDFSDVVLFALGVSLTSVTLVLDQALIGLLRGELQLWRNTIFAAVKLIALFGVDLWLARVTGLTIYVTLIIGNAFSLLVLAGMALLKRSKATGSYLPQWKLLRSLGPAALKHHTLNILLQAPSLILPVLVTIMLSPTVNAWFYMAWNLSSIANTVSVSFASTLYAVSAAKPSVLANKLRLTVSLAFVGCLLVNAILIVDPRLALELFGHSYSEQAAWSLRVLSLESFPFIIKNHYIALSRIRKQVGRTIIVTLATGLLELGSSVLGARLGGLNGLSLGWFSAMCFEALCMLPAVYMAAYPGKRARPVAVLADALETQGAWLLDTVKLPAPAALPSLGAQTVWLLDTLAMTAIRPGVDTLGLAAVKPGAVQTDTSSYRAYLQMREARKLSDPVDGRQRLRPTRLRRFSTYEHEAVTANRKD